MINIKKRRKYANMAVITQVTTLASIHGLAKYICLAFLICTAATHSNQTFAAECSNTQSIELGGSETISGTFGIKFGEDINPYLEGHYANEERILPELDAASSNAFRY